MHLRLAGEWVIMSAVLNGPVKAEGAAGAGYVEACGAVAGGACVPDGRSSGNDSRYQPCAAHKNH